MAKDKDNPDEGKGTGNGTPAGSGDSGSEGAVSMSQEALDSLIAKRANRAERSAVTNLLESVGFEDVEKLKGALTKLKTIEDGEKTDLEKAQTELASAQARVAELEDAVAKAGKTFKNFVLKTAAVDAARKKDFVDESLEDVWLLVQNVPDLMEGLKYDDETHAVEGATKVIDKVAKLRPHWVRAPKGRVTTPGRSGGSPPSPNQRKSEEPEVPLVRF